MSGRDGNAEARIQAAIVAYIRAVAPHCRPYAIPNGGYIMKPKTVARLKWMGLTPGVPDLGVMLPDGRTAYIEVKTASGRQSPEQRDFANWMSAHGTPHCLARSITDVTAALAAWGVQTREHQTAACRGDR